MRQNATSLEINKLKNNIIKEAGESNVYAFDMRKFSKDLKDHLFIMYAMSAMISIILFTLTFFELIVATTSNIRDD